MKNWKIILYTESVCAGGGGHQGTKSTVQANSDLIYRDENLELIHWV